MTSLRLAWDVGDVLVTSRPPRPHTTWDTQTPSGVARSERKDPGEQNVANERLRHSLRQAGITPAELSRLTGADIKTVYRWLSTGRAPLPRHRALIARRLGQGEEYLWPEVVNSSDGAAIEGSAEIVAAYSYRSDAPTALWWSLISRADRQVDLLGYTLYFLSLQHPELIPSIAQKCSEGLRVRAAIGDPDSGHIAYRDREEATPLTLAVRIQTTLSTWASLIDLEGFELRYQDIPLYNSIFRFDDEMLVTPHLFATPGSQAPMLHLRRLGPSGLFARFAHHFDSVWERSRTHDPKSTPVTDLKNSNGVS